MRTAEAVTMLIDGIWDLWDDGSEACEASPSQMVALVVEVGESLDAVDGLLGFGLGSDVLPHERADRLRELVDWARRVSESVAGQQPEELPAAIRDRGDR